MLSPLQLKQTVPLSAAAEACVTDTRASIERILSRDDHRLLVIVGPCSIHDVDAAYEYAERLHRLNEEVGEHLLLVMRTYFEKPRTTVGWRGLIADPYLDGSHDMVAGVRVARELLARLNELGIGCATESLDPSLVNFTDDLVAWTALGARTSESQIHRAMASGLPMPVGIKNGTLGQVDIALDAIETVASAQSYLAPDESGQTAVRHSNGNRGGHVVLRGGRDGPNFDRANVALCEENLRARQLPTNIVIDCSHANSSKQAERQIDVLDDITTQLEQGNESIVGVMLEGHLNGGNQPTKDGLADLKYGVSITDACLGWSDTERVLKSLALKAAGPLKERNAGTDRHSQQAAA
jgi:3-deoxy-7-phosphoheptulonate synthase